MEEREERTPLLASNRVLDLADEKGSFCGKILGDLGADVIKIEKPGGDPARHIGPFYKDIPHPERSLSWMYCNTSKRSITLDIERPAGKDIFRRLAKTADFLIESFPPGYMASLGLGHETLSVLNPRLIFTSITPFGQTGPYSSFKGADIVLWAMGGIMSTCGDLDRAPLRCTIPQAYYFGGLQGATGSLVAHYSREVSGEGQYVDVSIQESVLLNVPNVAMTWDMAKRNAVRSEATRRMLYPCKDGRVVASIGGAGVGWTQSNIALTKWLVEEGMAAELEHYDWTKYDNATITREEVQRIEEIMGNFFLSKTKQELYQGAVDRGFNLAPSTTAKDIVENIQLEARKFFTRVEHPELNDTLTYVGTPLKMSHHSWNVRRQPPLIGEHNTEIYEKELGLSPRELATLKRDKVI